MSNKTSQWLDSKKQFKGQKPGKALVAWLNEHPKDSKFVYELLMDAQCVFHWTRKYDSIRKLAAALKSKKLPAQFGKSHHSLNETLAKFAYAPQIDLHELPNGERVSLTLVTEDLSTALHSPQVRYVVQLIEQNAILMVRQCMECGRWYFAHFQNQKFCSTKCRLKHQSHSEQFKAHRREYMRDYYEKQRKTNVK
jgi:hypothetical protein